MGRWIKDILQIAFGVLAAAFGLEGFLIPNGFLDGGVTGVSLLIAHVTGWDFAIFLFLLNLPFILIGYRQVSAKFAFKTFFGIIALILATKFIHFPVLTDDKLLIAIFGGFFLGVGIGLAMRGGGVLDGTEVMALYFSRVSGFSVGDLIAGINVLIFLAAVWLINLETGLYSMLTYLAASKAIDYLIHGIEEYIGLTIVSDKNEAIRERIQELGRAVTVYRGGAGFGKPMLSEEKPILFLALTRLEVANLLAEIEEIDPKAFIIQQSLNDTRGGMIKRRALH